MPSGRPNAVDGVFAPHTASWRWRLDLLHRRHGWQGRLATALRHLRGWRDVFIEVQQT